MKLSSDEIAWALKKEIENFDKVAKVESVGQITEVGDGIAKAWGLDDVMMSELVEFENGDFGMALNLEKESVGIILFGDTKKIKEQDVVKRTGRTVSVPVGKGLIGRIVNPLGEPLDGLGPIEFEEYAPVERDVPNVVERMPVHEPVQTGIKAIDSMIPIGRGQRELLIGDRQTGKTTLILDTILNQKGKDNYCIYVAIGQKASTISQLVTILEEHGAMEYTTVVVASASDPPSLQYLAPYSGTAMGEYFLYRGEHAICFYDDLTKHAQAYRELALLLRRPPGREAFPGDIFYLHSRLLERAAKLNEEFGGGSLTSIPVIETQAGDVSSYIPTNVISITDGQIYLESDLFFAGILPAINLSLSASRVGGKAQTKAIKRVAQSLRLDLAQYKELAAFSQFSSELDDATKAQLMRGERMVEILKQKKLKPYSLADQVIIIFAGVEGYLDEIPLGKITEFENEYIRFIHSHYAFIIDSIMKTTNLDTYHWDELGKATVKFKEEFLNKIKQ